MEEQKEFNREEAKKQRADIEFKLHEKNNNNISKNIEDFECLACHKIRQRRCNTQSKKLPKGVMRKGAVTCSTKCRKKYRDLELAYRNNPFGKQYSPNINKASLEGKE